MKKHIIAVLCLVALLFASDEQYSIRLDEFRLGEELRLNALMAIGKPGQKILSEKPEVTSKAELYLRRKIDGKIYGLYSGVLNPDPYSKFYAFNLKEHGLSVKEVLQIKFYPKRRSKPYRDEMEIYLDAEYLYSPRLPVLYYLRNGEWSRLEASVAPGGLSVLSEDSNVTMKLPSNEVYPLPKRFFPVPSGLFYGTFEASGFLPAVEGFVVQPNKENTLRVSLLPNQAPHINFPSAVYANKLAECDSLEKVEKLYDEFRADSLKVRDTLSAALFEKVYPAKVVPNDTLQESYKKYSKEYESVKAKAKDAWLYLRIAPMLSVREMIFKKLEEFEKASVRLPVFPASLKIFRSKAKIQSVDSVQTQDSLVNAELLKKDSLKQDSIKTSDSAVTAPITEIVVVDSIMLKLVSTDNRILVHWTGKGETGSLDSLITGLKKGKYQIHVTLENNKPFWRVKNNVVASREHYRFVGIDFSTKLTRVKGVGNFKLPDSLLNQKEVQEWLNPSKVVVDTAKQEEKPVVKTDTVQTTVKESPMKMDSLKREYLVLDSSSFRFHGKVVGISSFAIQIKEVTQGDVARMIQAGKLDVKFKDRSKFKGENKPVQNITWQDAQNYCKALGGDLPTEAQWEFAARAGSNEGFVWEALEVGKADTYAIYKKNSGSLSSKDSAYGPQAVGSKKPNGWGIYDMAGNVAEWTRDNYSSIDQTPDDVDPKGSWMGYTKIIKGGSFKDKEKKLNAVNRENEDPRYWSEGLGFRCVFPAK